MLRVVFLLLAILANHRWVWDAGKLRTGEWHVWAGTLVRWEQGPHAYLEWDDEGLAWGYFWCTWQDPLDEFEADAWGCEGRVDWPHDRPDMLH